MRTINVKEIINTRGLDFREVARQLFPKNKYPDLALSRIIKGKATLNSDQISKLALMADLPISELFSGGDWKESINQGIYLFTKGDFRVELDPKTWITRIFHQDSLFHESILFSGATPVSEYFNQLDSIISNYKKQNV